MSTSAPEVPAQCFDPTGSVACFICKPLVPLVPATRDFEDVQRVYTEHAATIEGHSTVLTLCVTDGKHLHAWRPS